MIKRQKREEERRRYIRLDSVFPVNFQILSLDKKEFLSDWLQGFTNNVGRGGICLVVNNLKPELANLIKDKQVKINLEIEIPLGKRGNLATAQIIWTKEIMGEPKKMFIGLAYEEIDPLLNRRIMNYAWMKKLFTPVVLGVMAVLFLGVMINAYINIQLIKRNQALVNDFFKANQEVNLAKEKINWLNKERQILHTKIVSFHSKIKEMSKEMNQEARLLIDKLTQEKNALEKKLKDLQEKEKIATEEFLRLDQKKVILEKANFDKMYQWLKVHQNPRTGLVMSFEGDSDINNWAFIYDQALVIQAYTYFGDYERAKKILDFFAKKAKKINKMFVNAYYVNDGEPAEYILHSGPNIWIGIAILQYTNRSADHTYIDLAEELAQAIISLQNEDEEGGLRGGPNTTWYSTEHNLDAYAFFHMLYKLTHKPIYAQARDKILNWLIKHTYDRVDIPIKRGKGDSTIATDTYAWSIAAIGPEKLKEIGMNPDKIMEFAEENCAKEVNYQRPDGQIVKIKGFDFAPQRHLSRAGVVSSEWTAQMILAFKIMADFYVKTENKQQANIYEQKAKEYLSELTKMIISSPSPSGQGESCVAYATQDFVDTGHGWFTPKGKSTGSVAGTTYALFAYYGYNPLEIKE